MARPIKEIAWETVDGLCAIQCTGEEISSVLNINYDTLNRACKRVHGVSFTDYYKQKSQSGKVALRRAQFRLAVEDGNPTMMIWLGKQHLGQRDKSDVENTHGVTDQFAELLAHVASGSKRIGS